MVTKQSNLVNALHSQKVYTNNTASFLHSSLGAPQADSSRRRHPMAEQHIDSLATFS